MQQDEGFLLIDAMLSLSIIMLICAVLIPLLHQMNDNYRESFQELGHYREFYVYVKSGGTVVENGKEWCRKEAGPGTTCIQKR